MAEKIEVDISAGGVFLELRIRSGLSQEQVAAKLQLLGISVGRGVISRVEKGNYQTTLKLIQALCGAYRCEAEDYFEICEGVLKETKQG